MSFLSFALLQERLVEVLRSKVRNGETTERGLAKLTGISQPHMHNVLKAQRLLSGELADLILQKLNLTTLDLMDREEMVAFLNRHANLEARAVPIPVLEGLLGPGLPLPRQVPSPRVHTVPQQQAVAATQPVVVQLADDPEMRSMFEAGDYVLLDQSETLRTHPQPLNFYIVNTPTGALVRAIRRGAAFFNLPDMDFGARDAAFVPFFGVPAATLLAPARMARALGMTVQPVLAEILPAGAGYRVRFLPPWEDFPGDDDLAAATRMNRWIEDEIRRNPAQYLWVHKRFKTRPPGETGFYG